MMLSKADRGKKADENSGTGKFTNDLQTLCEAFYVDKTLWRFAGPTATGRSKSIGKSHLSDPKRKPKNAKNCRKDSSDKEKKPSIWSWKGLKALTQPRKRRFNCCFSLLVHSIDGLPAFFDDVCLVVHWMRRDGELMTHPIQVYQGAAEFEAELTYSCSVYGGRSCPNHLAKYEPKQFLLYASIYNAPELDLGKHRIDLTRLLPLTLEELEEEKNSGKWTTSFKLLGKATGATMYVSFGYVVTGNNSIKSFSNKNDPEILSLRQNSEKTENFMRQVWQMDQASIHRAGSLPARLTTLNQSAEDIKDLHEILPISRSVLPESVNVLHQKLDEEMSKASVKNKLDADPLCSHVDPSELNPFTPSDVGEKIFETAREIREFAVVEKGTDEFTKEQVKSAEDPSKVAEASGEVLEADSPLEVPLNMDVLINPSAEEIVSQKDKPSISTCNYNGKENKTCSKESIIIELDTALSCASDLINEGLDSPQDRVDILHQEHSFDIYSHHRDCRKGKSLSLDDITDSVASDFLDMLGIEHSPFALSSESEPESPRERLLKQFEKDALANGRLLNFDIESDPAEVVSGIQMGSVWGSMPSDFHQSSARQDFQEMPKIKTDASRTKTRASRLEDLESEALMRDWGLNEKAFQHSPPSNSHGCDSPVNVTPEDLRQLPSLAEGLGPFVQTKNGGSLILQVSSTLVVPAEMGSDVMDVLQGLAAVGIEKLSKQANKLMPLEDITGKTIQQIAWEAAPILEGPQRQGLWQHHTKTTQNMPSERKNVEGISSGPGSGKFDSTLFSPDTEYVFLDDLAPLAMDKIEALSIEGLRIQSEMSDKDAPSNISAQSIGDFLALKGTTLNVCGSMDLNGRGVLQLLDIKDKGEHDGLMGLSLTLGEWMKLDSGDIEDDDLFSERTSKILEAHHASSLDLFGGRFEGDKRRQGRGRKYGSLGNNLTFALMVQLHDPLRNYEPVGTAMFSLIQVGSVIVSPSPKSKIYSISPARNSREDEENPEDPRDENTVEKPKDDRIHEELIPQYKITEVHVAGLKTQPGKKKLWGTTNQQKSGSRWLLANGMGKKNKHPLMKSKPVVQGSDPASSTMTARVQPGDTLWRISSCVHKTGSKKKELAAVDPHVPNPNVLFPNESRSDYATLK